MNRRRVMESVMFESQRTRDLFMSKIDVEGGPDACWPWIGARYSDGYGAFDGLRSHRLSWILFRFQVPNSLWVLHRCDVPSCVNPDHLFLGTHLDNMRDCRSKGRGGERTRTLNRLIREQEMDMSQ